MPVISAFPSLLTVPHRHVVQPCSLRAAPFNPNQSVRGPAPLSAPLALWTLQRAQQCSPPPPSISINVNAFCMSLWPSSVPPHPAHSLNCTSLYTWGQFLERLAAGTDRLQALPHLVRPTSINSISTGVGKEKQRWRLFETGTWDSQIPLTAPTVANIRIKYT